MQRPAPTSVRTLLVSDVHLGSKHSRAEEFLLFLREFKPDSLYLVGDFIDGWKINTGWRWSSVCDEIIAHLINLSQQGTKIHYVPGNHDAFLRNPAFRAGCLASFPRFEVANEFVLETASGWKFLITHGDLFDCVEKNTPWLSKGTTTLYDACLSMNRWYHRAWQHKDRNPYGACSILKDRVKRWIRFVSDFESRILHHAKQNQCDGVICGHIHTPDIVTGDAMWYCNTGDWVENCTGLVERHDGQLHLVRRYDEDLFLRLPAHRESVQQDLCDRETTGTEQTEFFTVSAGASPGGYAA